MANIVVSFLPLFVVISYIGYTFNAVIKKKKDGVQRAKTAISMILFGGLFVLLIVFQFISYANAVRIGADDAAIVTARVTVICFFIAAYLIYGGIFLLRQRAG